MIFHNDFCFLLKEKRTEALSDLMHLQYPNKKQIFLGCLCLLVVSPLHHFHMRMTPNSSKTEGATQAKTTSSLEKEPLTKQEKFGGKESHRTAA